MKWHRSELNDRRDRSFSFQENLTFSPEEIQAIPRLLDLKDVCVSGVCHFDPSLQLLSLSYRMQGVMIVPCAITNEAVDYPFVIEDELTFGFLKNQELELEAIQGDEIDLRPVLWQSIAMEVPLKVVKADLQEYPKGDGWEVLKEEQLTSIREPDPRLAKLKEFKTEE